VRFPSLWCENFTLTGGIISLASFLVKFSSL
jgi:hypothetical protein